MLFGRGCMTMGGVRKIVTRGSGRCPWKYISRGLHSLVSFCWFGVGNGQSVRF